MLIIIVVEKSKARMSMIALWNIIRLYENMIELILAGDLFSFSC